MARIIREADVLELISQYSDAAGVDTRHVLQSIVSDMKQLPAQSIGTGIPLQDFKNSFAQRETVWLRDQSTGRIVARGGRRLRCFRDVTVTGVYPAFAVEGDGSTARSVLVCWGDHEEIVSAGG